MSNGHLCLVWNIEAFLMVSVTVRAVSPMASSSRDARLRAEALSMPSFAFLGGGGLPMVEEYIADAVLSDCSRSV